MQRLPGQSQARRYSLTLVAGLTLLLCADLLGFDSHGQLWLSVSLAFALFILPGGLLITAAQAWLPVSLPRFISYGFATSLVLISIIGILARSLHWTFAGILLLWFCLTLASILAFAFKSRGQRIIGGRPALETLLLILVIFVTLSLFAYSGMHFQPLRNDQHALNSIALAFTDGGPLNWQEWFYDTGERMNSRHFLTFWELARALVSAVGRQHILRADFIINSLLMVVSVCAVHSFARDMGESPRTAWLIVLLHLCCYALLLGGMRQPGAQFAWRVVEDKLVAGFVVAPLALSAAHRAYVAPSRQAYAAFFLSFLALLFAHVMMAGFALIAIVIGFAPRLLTASSQRRSSVLAILLMALLVFSPGIVMRLQIGNEDSAWNFGSEAVRTNRDVLAINLRNPLTGETLVRHQPVGCRPAELWLAGFACAGGGISTARRAKLAAGGTGVDGWRWLAACNCLALWAAGFGGAHDARHVDHPLWLHAVLRAGGALEQAAQPHSCSA